MRDSALRLQDKNVVLIGPFCGVTQSILRSLTEFGADVGFVCQQGTGVGKFIDGINEGREVHSHYGRGVHLNIALGNEAQMQEAMGMLVGQVGRMDVLIDATPLAWTSETAAAPWASLATALAEKLIPFLLAKQRGRVMYLFEDPSLDAIRGSGPGDCHLSLRGVIESLARKYAEKNIMVNGLSLGVTDDFILKMFPGSGSLKKSFGELSSKHPGLKLVDFNDIASTVAYLSSVLSTGLTGEVLHLTHGFHLATPPKTVDVTIAAV